jgi:DNA-binding winged helix-turn-helix (wHTH) protein
MNTPQVPIVSRSSLGDPSAAGLLPTRYARFGAFQLDLQKQELFKEGTRVKLQGKVCQALLALLERPSEVVTREELRTRLWPAETHVNYDANVNTTVNKLRQVLGDSTDQPVYVETIPKRGYSFVAQVEYVNEPAPRIFAAQFSKTVGGHVSGQVADSSVGPTVGGNAWAKAGAVALVIAGMLFGAAIILFLHRAA